MFYRMETTWQPDMSRRRFDAIAESRCADSRINSLLGRGPLEDDLNA